MKKVLIGSTNPSKVQRFSHLLAGTDTQVCTLSQLGVTEEPRETGRTPLENARIKAAFYSRYADSVICNDAGLYIRELAREDPRQPGMHVRAPGGVRLSDEEMIAHYAALAHCLGGRMTACYLDGVAVWDGGRMAGFMEEELAAEGAFYMVDTPHAKRHAGWPLDSLSVSCRTGRYFVEEEMETDAVIRDAYWRALRAFLLEALHLPPEGERRGADR